MFEASLPYGDNDDQFRVTRGDADFAYVHVTVNPHIFFSEGAYQTTLLIPSEAIALANALLSAALHN